MIDSFRSELLKARTTRSFWWTLVIGYGLVVLFVVVPLVNGINDENGVRELLSTSAIIGILMIILGVVGAGGEYRHGTITSSLLTVPNRVRFLFPKAAAFMLSGAAAALLGSALTLAITIPWLNGDGTSIPDLGVSNGDAIAIVLSVTAYAAIGAAFGVAIGALLRNQIAAIVGVLMLFLFIDPLLVSQFEAYGPFSLTGIGESLDGIENQGSGYDPFPAATAAGVFLGYVGVLLAACVALDSRRDVAS